MDFNKWFAEADMPTKDQNGNWYDAETGFAFTEKSVSKKAIEKTDAQMRYGACKASELKATVERLMNSQRIEIARTGSEVAKAVVSAYEAFNGKMTKSEMIELIDMNSSASRVINKARSAK